MNNERELLELAAKAAGIPQKVVGAAPGRYALYPETDGVEEFCCIPQWNPLTDDGDALRLAVKMGMDIKQTALGAFVSSRSSKRGGRSPAYFDMVVEEYGDHDGDWFAATRRAILLAAAEIGKAMP